MRLALPLEISQVWDRNNTPGISFGHDCSVVAFDRSSGNFRGWHCNDYGLFGVHGLHQAFSRVSSARKLFMRDQIKEKNDGVDAPHDLVQRPGWLATMPRSFRSTALRLTYATAGLPDRRKPLVSRRYSGLDPFESWSHRVSAATALYNFCVGDPDWRRSRDRAGWP